MFLLRPLPSLALFLSFLSSLFLLVPAAPVSAQSRSIVINSSVTIVESAQEPGPVHRSTQDLVSDFTKVFGRAPKLVTSLEQAGPVAILIAQRENLPAGRRLRHHSRPRSLCILRDQLGRQSTSSASPARTCAAPSTPSTSSRSASSASTPCICGLTSSRRSARRSRCPRISPAVYPSPVFKYRGFFTNDEDLLTRLDSARRKASTRASRSRSGTWSLKPFCVSRATWWCRAPGSFPMTRRCTRPLSAA